MKKLSDTAVTRPVTKYYYLGSTAGFGSSPCLARLCTCGASAGAWRSQGERQRSETAC